MLNFPLICWVGKQNVTCHTRNHVPPPLRPRSAVADPGGPWRATVEIVSNTEWMMEMALIRLPGNSHLPQASKTQVR